MDRQISDEASITNFMADSRCTSVCCKAFNFSEYLRILIIKYQGKRKQKIYFKSENNGFSFLFQSGMGEGSFTALWLELIHTFKTLTLRGIKEVAFHFLYFTEEETDVHPGEGTSRRLCSYIMAPMGLRPGLWLSHIPAVFPGDPQPSNQLWI